MLLICAVLFWFCFCFGASSFGRNSLCEEQLLLNQWPQRTCFQQHLVSFCSSRGTMKTKTKRSAREACKSQPPTGLNRGRKKSCYASPSTDSDVSNLIASAKKCRDGNENINAEKVKSVSGRTAKVVGHCKEAPVDICKDLRLAFSRVDDPQNEQKKFQAPAQETIFSPAFHKLNNDASVHSIQDCGRDRMETDDIVSCRQNNIFLLASPDRKYSDDNRRMDTQRCLSEAACQSIENQDFPKLSTTLLNERGQDLDVVDGGISNHSSSLFVATNQSNSLECNDESDHDPGTPDDDDDMDDFDPYLFIKNLPNLSEVVSSFRPMLLPKRTRRCPPITLVLDLDETLVHSTLDPCDDADFSFPVNFNLKQHTVYVRCRPHLQFFMDRVADMFEIIVFTASQSIYAEQLLNILDPRRKLIRHRVYRESCVYVAGNYLKDLSILGRDLAQVVIVDNSPQAFGFQIDNGIPIESWFDDRSDSALIALLPFLESLVGVDDVRPIIAKKFNLRQKIEGATEHSLLGNREDSFDQYC